MSDGLDEIRLALPNYEIAHEIGRGGWGVVLLATHRDLHRRVAIKQLPQSIGADPVLGERFRAEARLVASLDHPHIVPVFDFVDRDGLSLLVMEYMAGGTLWDRFRTEGLTTDHSCALMLAASAALHYAHRQDVLHRDVKPENFLFNASGTIKLADFGIAKLVNAGQTSFTLAGQVVGTPAYMAPEQATGGDLTPATDVYACGAMLYELLTGELPFPETGEVLSQLFMRVSRNPTPIAEIRPDLPYVIGEVVMMALRTDPAARYQSAEQFGIALAHAATRAFGSGWLMRTGVPILGAPAILAATEQATDPSLVVAARPDAIRPSSAHARLSQVLGGSRAPDTPTRVPAAPAPTPARVTLDTPGPGPLVAPPPSTTPPPPPEPAPLAAPPVPASPAAAPAALAPAALAPAVLAPPPGAPALRPAEAPPGIPREPLPAPGTPDDSSGSPPRPRRALVLAAVAILAVVVVGVAVVALRPRTTEVVTPPGSSAPTSTTAGAPPPSTAPGSSIAPTTTSVPYAAVPTVTALEPDGSGTLQVSWADSDPTRAHFIDVRMREGDRLRTQRLLVTSSPHRIAVPDGTPTCVALSVAGDGNTTRSDVECTNGGRAADGETDS